MKKLVCIALLALAGGLFSLNAWADSQTGLGIFVGGTDTAIKPALGQEIDVSGSGYGVDFQFPLNETFSIVPFYLVTSGDGTDPNPGAPTPIEVETTAAGLQLRVWIGNVFVGLHGARYDVDVISSGITQTFEESGSGVAVGWESHNGFLLTVRSDSVTFDFPGQPQTGAPAQEVEVETVSAYLGFRF